MLTSTMLRQGSRKILQRGLTSELRLVRCLATIAPHPRTSIDMPAGLDASIPPPAIPARHAAVDLKQHKIGTMPPGYNARVGQLDTFELPDQVTGCKSDIEIGKALVRSWQKDGILQIAMNPEQRAIYKKADAASKAFFAKTPVQKAACIDSLSYAGYIASGEEITDGVADYSEIFTVTKDLPLEDPRVVNKWPCHGRCPWPDHQMKAPISQYIEFLGQSGDRLLKLIELGLNVPVGSLTKLAEDGWHHLRVLRFPATNNTNGKGKEGRGIGSHTDYGLLVIAAQDEVGGLFVRPPYKDESFANWDKSSAGMNENDDKWVYVPPVDGVFTVFPGDMLQYITNSVLPSTPHKVGLNTRERFAFAYFHEPNFRATLKPLPGYQGGQTPDKVHYGTHFTNMFMRNYPQRITTQRLVEEGRYALLESEELRTH